MCSCVEFVFNAESECAALDAFCGLLERKEKIPKDLSHNPDMHSRTLLKSNKKGKRSEVILNQRVRLGSNQRREVDLVQGRVL